MSDRKISVVEGQDPKTTAPINRKVKVNRMQPVEETMSMHDVDRRITDLKAQIDSHNQQIERIKAEIADYTSLKVEIEKAIGG